MATPGDARLNVLLPTGERLTHVISGTEITLGRDASCDVTIDDASVSRTHARLVRTEDGWHIIDANSVNGTWIDGQQVRQATVHFDAAIRLGSTEIRLAWAPDPGVTQTATFVPTPAQPAATPRAPAVSSQPPPAPAPPVVTQPAAIRAAPAAVAGRRPFARLAQLMLLLSGVGGVLVVIGSSMTWGEADVPLLGTVTLDGMAPNRQGDITQILGAIAVVVALSGVVRPYLAVRAFVSFGLGVATLVLVLDDARELQDIAAFVGDIPVVGDVIEPEVGTGLILVASGASAILVCAGICLGLLYTTGRYWKA